jgi:phenylacetate-CoA ligase
MITFLHHRKVDGLTQRSWYWLLRNIVLPTGDLALGHRMIKRLRFLEDAQWWDSDRLNDYRDRSLRSLIHLAYQEVPFYRGLMRNAGVKPDDVVCRSDLYKLPIVTKEMLRSGYPQLTTRETGRKTYEVCTSGSTGTNFCVAEDPETAGRHRASFLLALEWSGWRIGDRHLQTGMTPDRSLEKRVKDTLLGCYYVSAFDLSDTRLDKMLELLDRRSIQYLWGYPGSLYCLARQALKKGWNRPLKSVVTWGDNLYSHYRKTIERAFTTRVFDTYGCAEGMQVSAQCGQDNAYHIHALDVIVEFLDDEGNPVRSGQPGNILLTRLYPGPMPLIRYRVGDVGIAGNGHRCSCGRGYDLMESIQGRDTDVVITPTGNRLIVHFFTGILEHFPEIESFQVVQESMESMVIRIVPTEQFSEESSDRIVAALQEKEATGIRIEIELVDRIPLTLGGKRRFVISNATKPGDEHGLSVC